MTPCAITRRLRWWETRGGKDDINFNKEHFSSFNQSVPSLPFLIRQKKQHKSVPPRTLVKKLFNNKLISFCFLRLSKLLAKWHPKKKKKKERNLAWVLVNTDNFPYQVRRMILLLELLHILHRCRCVWCFEWVSIENYLKCYIFVPHLLKTFSSSPLKRF